MAICRKAIRHFPLSPLLTVSTQYRRSIYIYRPHYIFTDSMAVGWDAIYSAGVVHWQVGEVQVLQCFFKPRQWLLEVDSTTKLVRPGSASTPPSDLDVNNRRFAVTNPQGEYPYRPNQGTAFEDDVDMVRDIYQSLLFTCSIDGNVSS